MQLGDPGLELERVLTHPRNKPLSGEERAVLNYELRLAKMRFPPPVGNPDNPIRCWWCPWGKKDILNERDALNRYAKKVIADNALRSQDFAREVLIHLGFTLPEIIEREKAQLGKEVKTTQTLGQVDLPTTVRTPVLTSQQPARTLAQPAMMAPRQPQWFPWVMLGLAVMRLFR